MLAARRGLTAFRAAPVARTVPALVPCVTRPLQSSSYIGSPVAAPVLSTGSSRGSLVVMAASMGQTINGKSSNKKRRTTSGFRARLETVGGRKVLKARRKKGRHVLAPASQKKSGGKK